MLKNIIKELGGLSLDANLNKYDYISSLLLRKDETFIYVYGTNMERKRKVKGTYELSEIDDVIIFNIYNDYINNDKNYLKRTKVFKYTLKFETNRHRKLTHTYTTHFVLELDDNLFEDIDGENVFYSNLETLQ